MPGATTERTPGTSGRYQLQQLIGKGGQCRVYRAMRDDGQPFAVKVMIKKNGRLPMSAAVHAQKAVRNSQAAAAASPHVERLEETYFDTARGVMVVAELIENAQRSGDWASALLADEGADELITAMAQTTHAVVAMHRAGIIHRDLKPLNVLMQATDNGPHATVIDFLIAVSNDTTGSLRKQWAGTPDFMAPERKGDTTFVGNEASDRHELGLTWRSWIKDALGIPARKSAELEAICDELCQENPMNRPQFDHVLARLDETMRRWRSGAPAAAADSEGETTIPPGTQPPGTQPPDTTLPVPAKPQHRLVKPAIIFAAATLVLGLAGVAINATNLWHNLSGWKPGFLTHEPAVAQNEPKHVGGAPAATGTKGGARPLRESPSRGNGASTANPVRDSLKARSERGAAGAAASVIARGLAPSSTRPPTPCDLVYEVVSPTTGLVTPVRCPAPDSGSGGAR